MPNPTISQALAEAYASAPNDVVILDTLELRHPGFIEDDQQVAVRVVRDTASLTAQLEADAPMNAGEVVTFEAVGFDLTKPPVDTIPLPELELTISNVSRRISRLLNQAVTGQYKNDIIRVTYRAYLSSDLNGPHTDPPFHLTLSNVSVQLTQVVGRARMPDIGNKAFPGVTYNSQNFPTLTR